jgi:hypothetical protein
MLGFVFLNFDHVPVLEFGGITWVVRLPDAPVGNVAQMWGITMG